MSELLYKPEKSDADINELISQHKNLVYYMLGRMGRLNHQDCESAAYEALWDAVCTFDIYSTGSFSTYACTLIRNAVNNELRKAALQQGRDAAMMELADTNGLFLPTAVDVQDNRVTTRVEQLFDKYVSGKSGTCRNVLLTWQASGFEAPGKVIARICRCSGSYVSRVQNDFRAFLQYKMKRP